MQHRLAAVLTLAACAVLAGARSYTAVAEWAAATDSLTRAALGLVGAVPSGSTFRRVLQALGPTLAISHGQSTRYADHVPRNQLSNYRWPRSSILLPR